MKDVANERQNFLIRAESLFCICECRRKVYCYASVVLFNRSIDERDHVNKEKHILRFSVCFFFRNGVYP